MKTKVLFAAGEAAPFIKVGGLADVAAALPAALVRKGIDARVILPLYAVMGEMREKAEFVTSIYIDNAWRKQYCGLFKYKQGDVTYYFVDNEYYFLRSCVYGDIDDGERFAFFSRAVLELLPFLDFMPDILHCNDWHTALIPVFLDTQFRHRPGYGMIKTVFTIHNIEFQGKFDPYILGNVFGLDEKMKPLLYYGDCINLMKGAIECANAVTTVSPTYAKEICDPFFAYGLEYIVRARQFKICGILNGIDTELYNPQTDKDIKTNFSIETRQLKYHNKTALRKQLGLSADKAMPLIGMVTRLSHQKGIDLVCRCIDGIMEQNVQLVILGTGDMGYEQFLSAKARQYPLQMAVITAFDSVLARQIYAGCDFFLMPSQFEPCGLAQMIAMQYGTVPIVRETGGLYDTVTPYNEYTGEGRGITFSRFDCEDMMFAISRAIELFNDKKAMGKVRQNAMSGEYGWNKGADRYIELYRSIL